MPDAHPSIRPIVLFLCTGNYYRSRYAEILFNHLAGEQALAWVAESRGLDLALGVNNVGPLSPHTRRLCHARGLPLPDPLRSPTALSEQDLQRAELVIAVKQAEHRPYLTKLFPAWVDRVRYWHVDDLDCAPAEQALADLERLVRELIAELSVHT